jgi:KDO2-lipid IV(A) lauroyltransferase
VVPIRCERLDGFRFHITVDAPWHFDTAPEQPREDAVRAALVRINARLEDWIRERPGQWLWMHKRWPKET